MAGQANAQARPEYQCPQRHHANRRIAQVCRRQRHRQRTHFLQVVLWHMSHLQAEEILNLHGADGDADPRGKAQGYGKRNVLNQPAKARQAEQNQKYPGHQGRHQQPGEAELLGYRIEDHHKGCGRPGDAEARPSGQGNHNPGDGGGIQAVLGGHAAANRQRHCQRNGNDTDGDPGDKVTGKA